MTAAKLGRTIRRPQATKRQAISTPVRLRPRDVSGPAVGANSRLQMVGKPISEQRRSCGGRQRRFQPSTSRNLPPTAETTYHCLVRIVNKRQCDRSFGKPRVRRQFISFLRRPRTASMSRRDPRDLRDGRQVAPRSARLWHVPCELTRTRVTARNVMGIVQGELVATVRTRPARAGHRPRSPSSAGSRWRAR